MQQQTQNKMTTHVVEHITGHVAELYHSIEHELQQQNISLNITRKRVKNINFRLKPHMLSVSAPHYISDTDILVALTKRLDWAITQHAHILKRQRDMQSQGTDMAVTGLRLWGEVQPFVMGEAEQVKYYRQQLQQVMPSLFGKWQPIVGQRANETRIKKMKTRWGTCNTKARRIWLSVYLPAYPIECTEYVIVHELCHLHHANHSARFWHEVKKAMPDYKQWHDMLAGKLGVVD